MRQRPLLFSTFAFAFLLAACGGGQVTVQVLTEGGEEGQLQPQRDLVVQFLPFDRDSIFEVLEQTAEDPEPQVPQELQTTMDSVAGLQDQWREADTEWAEVRDELQQLSSRLRGMDQRSREYRELFDRFNQLEQRERSLNRVKTEAFQRFTDLQQQVLARADSIRAIREAWADIAFQDYAAIVDSILEAEGREIREDTTGTDGYASASLPGSGWWVHTRVPVGQFDELYWNVPVEPAETDTLRLTSENAERRLRL